MVPLGLQKQNRHPAKKQSVSMLGTGLDRFQHQCKENMEGVLIGEDGVGMPRYP